MKKILMILVVMVCFGISASAQRGEHYKESYASNFVCWVKSGGGAEALIVYVTGEYQKGYAAGYADGERDKKKEAFLI